MIEVLRDRRFRSMSTSLILALWLASPASAQDDAAALAKATQNPLAAMISLPIQSNLNFGLGEYGRTQHVLNLQPAIPLALGDWTLINRFIAPVIHQPIITDESRSMDGLGDIIYQGFFAPQPNNGLTYGFGPVASLATATEQILGSEKWTVGPGLILVKMTGPWVLGGVAWNTWSFAGDDNRPETNAMGLQYFINYNLPDAWFLTTSPMITANWMADEGNKWTVPFGAGVGKVFAVGPQMLNGNMAGYWNAVTPDNVDGPDWTLRLQLVFLFPSG